MRRETKNRKLWWINLPVMLGVGLFAILALSGAAAPPPADRLVSHGIEIDKPIIHESGPGVVYLLVNFDAIGIPEEAHIARPPVNLALVLDRSGSMADKGKLDYLIQAAKTVVDNLSPHDRLSIVEYDDVITVMWPSGPVESPSTIKRLIDNLTPRGSTNLVGGMMQGVEEVFHNQKPEYVNRVLLLSDGLANQGVTDPREIRQMVRAARHDGVRISTLGLGLDYNEDLMQDIAENAAGNYYYVEHPTQMSRIFQEELNTLFSTIARDIEFIFEPGPQVRDIRIMGYDTTVKNGATHISMSDFYAEEKRTLLLRLEVEPKALGSLSLGSFRFAYHGVDDGKAYSYDTPLTVTVSRDDEAIQKAANDGVAVEAKLAEAEVKHRKVLDLYADGKWAEADTEMGTLYEEVEAAQSNLDDERLNTKLQALSLERGKMKDAQANASAQSAYLKKSKQRLYQAQKGKRAMYALKPGAKGLEVEQLQQSLTDAGYYNGPIDGQFSDKVAAAVTAFQQSKNLDSDGVAGPETMDALGLY